MVLHDGPNGCFFLAVKGEDRPGCTVPVVTIENYPFVVYQYGLYKRAPIQPAKHFAHVVKYDANNVV